MTAAILFTVAILAIVALYWIHTWREVRLAQASYSLEIAQIIRGGGSHDQRVLDALDHNTAALQRFVGMPPAPASLKSDNLVRPEFGHRPKDDPTGGDAA